MFFVIGGLEGRSIVEQSDIASRTRNVRRYVIFTDPAKGDENLEKKGYVAGPYVAG